MEPVRITEIAPTCDLDDCFDSAMSQFEFNGYTLKLCTKHADVASQVFCYLHVSTVKGKRT